MQEIFHFFERYFDRNRCSALVEKIYENDRFFDFKSFAKTAFFCADYLNEIGCEEVSLLPVKADGKTAYGDWVVPRAWDVESAVLRYAESKIEIADYHKTPCSLAMYSAPTPKDGIVAELVNVSGSEEMPSGYLRGKLLLTDRPAKELVELALQEEAAGIISDFFPLYEGVRDSRWEMYDESRWDNDFITPVNDTGLFAFDISPKWGDVLREQLTIQSVTLHAQVQTKFYDGYAPTVSAAILGQQQNAPEIFLYGHLYEPGANDNASGCAVLMELMRCLQSAIQKGEIPRPRYTIRLALGYECTGSVAFLSERSEIAARILCGIVADMVGTERIDKAVMTLRLNPLSGFSYLDRALLSVNEAYRYLYSPAYRWRICPFTIASDNMIADPVWKIPTVGMIAEPAQSYHSSLDKPDRIEPDILRRTGMILGVLIYRLARAEAVDLVWARQCYFNAMTTVMQTGLAGHQIAVAAAIKASCLPLKRLGAISEEDEKSLPPLPVLPKPPKELGNMAEKVPVRLVKGCLTFGGRPELRDSKWQPAWNDTLNLPLFWADGKRTLWEISYLFSAEKNQINDEEIIENYCWIAEYFTFLEQTEYLMFANVPSGGYSI